MSTSRPTTPIRRISRGTLSALSLSQSGQRQGDPLKPLEGIAAELSDSLDILATNLEHLDSVNTSLDDFNDAFASFLYALKLNAYTADFTQCPTTVNFELAAANRRTLQAQVFSDNADPLTTTSRPSSRSSQHDTASETNSEEQQGDATFQSHTSHSQSRSMPVRSVRGTKAAANSSKRHMAWVQSVIQTLEIKYREKEPYKSEVEQVLLILRRHPQGL